MKQLLWIVGLSVSLCAQWLHQPTADIQRTPDGTPDLTAPAPRSSDGKPDLSGLWRINANPVAADISRLLQPADIEPWAATLHQQRKERLGADSFSIACLPAGPLYSVAGTMDGIKIVQTRKLIVILYPDMNFRQIFLDGRELPNDPNPTWLGYSVGRWDGDTLVVETAGLNDRTWLDFEGHPHSERLHITERFRRIDQGHMDLEVTFRDPEIYAKPMVIPSRMEAVFDTEILEYVCAENEKDRVHLVGKASDDQAVTVPDDVLQAYIGEYDPDPAQGRPPGPPIVVTVTLENHTLTMSTGRGLVTALTPLSLTRFGGLGGQVEFGRNDEGEVTQLTIRVVEGDFRLIRRK